MQWDPEIAPERFGVQARMTAPPPLLSRQLETGARGREQRPRSKNMSTNSKWTPGCRPPFKCRFCLPAPALYPLGLGAPGSFSPEKRGGAGNFEMARGLPRESERAAPGPALFRVPPKYPETPPPGPGGRGGGGRRLQLAYSFVAERGDPRLPLVERLLEVAVLWKQGGAGSGWPPWGSGAPGAPRTSAPRPAAGGPSRPQCAPSSPASSRTRGHRAVRTVRGCLPVAAASSGQLAGRGGSRGHPEVRPEQCKFAGRAACGLSVSACRGRGEEQRAK